MMINKDKFKNKIFKTINPRTERIYLILGDSCNLNCKYCMQREKKVTHTKLSLSLKKFIRNIFAYNDYYYNQCIHLVYFGGEPLLYWSEIIKTINFINKLKNKYNINPIQQELVTNGRLLTQDKINILNQNNILVHISYDGKTSLETRGYDVIEEKKDLILQLNSLQFITTLTSKNYLKEPLNTLNELNKEYYKKHNYNIFYTKFNIVTNADCNELANINHERFIKEFHEAYDIYEKYILMSNNNDPNAAQYKNDNFIIVRYIQSYVYMLLNRDKNSRHILCCSSTCLNNNYSINLKGEILSCINQHDTVLGTVNDDYNKILNNTVFIKLPMYNRYFEQCMDCEVREACIAGCVNINLGELNCSLMKEFYNNFVNRTINLSKKIGK